MGSSDRTTDLQIKDVCLCQNQHSNLTLFISQVRPKPTTPNNVPIAPAPPPPMMAAPQLLQRPVMLATKLTSALPASAGPIHQVRIVNGQPCAIPKTVPSTGASTGQVTGIVISGPVQTLQISSLNADIKVSSALVVAPSYTLFAIIKLTLFRFISGFKNF